MVRAKNQARSFSGEPLANRLDLLRRRFLFGDEVIKTKDHQGIGVREHALVDRLFHSGLIYPLVHGDLLTGRLSYKLLKTQEPEVE
jgi:hypothetical protein